MDHRSSSISPRRYRNGGNGDSGGYRRYSRSRSRSRDRGRDINYRNTRNIRSRSRDCNYKRGDSNDNDLYRDIINQDYQDDRNYSNSGSSGYSRGGGGGNNYRSRNSDNEYVDERDRYRNERSRDNKGRNHDRDADNRDGRDSRRYGNNGNSNSNRRYNTADRDDDDSDDTISSQYYNKTPSNTIIVFGLQSHITEADIMSYLILIGMSSASVRLIRKRSTGESRGFAFVEFKTVEEAAQWMEVTQGSLQLQDTCRATLQYSHTLQASKTKINPTDWYCGKCGMFNFKRRDSCFKCYASRVHGAEGTDEISSILTKKIMLRNLDVLTNEEGVLTAVTKHAPDLAEKIIKVLVSHDSLTQTSRGVCYLHFDSLVNSMNMHNLLSTLEPPLKIDNKEVLINYSVDYENPQIEPKKSEGISPTEAIHSMDLNDSNGKLVSKQQEISRGTQQCNRSSEFSKTKPYATDWYCGKCGMFNFKRRDSCFQCNAAREETERGVEGNDEISSILTKKIMLRNLDVLTNEEGVLTAITQHAADLAEKISKVVVGRDTLTQTSRGICYLHFDSLVDSMNTHNLLSTLEPPLKIDNKEVFITYCIDHENRQIVPKKSDTTPATGSNSAIIGPITAADMSSATATATGDYTLADVPRLAEYSASIYANTPAEHAYYLQFYTQYYISEISKGSYNNLPTDSQVTGANSATAVASSAIQRKHRKLNSIETTTTPAAIAAATAAAAVRASVAARVVVVTPRGNDGKIYPTPDVSLYRYDETSGYYYDPTTGLYYDAHSQYYYNNETGAYLYWDQRKSSYILATPAAAAAAVKNVVKKEIKAENKSAEKAEEESSKKDKKDSGNKNDKVKVAKKIVKDMEKWAKQLNQKKDYTVVATPQPILSTNSRTKDVQKPFTSGGISSGYADVGFSILEKKTTKLGVSNAFTSPLSLSSTTSNKFLPSHCSDSDEDMVAPPAPIISGVSLSVAGDKYYVDYQKLTCLLCKRAFQSLETLQKHLKLSNLHKENLAKHLATKQQQHQHQQQTEEDSLTAALSYRDRANERRQKYGESDPPPPNRSRERFEKEIKNFTSKEKQQNTPAMAIGSNNVGNRLMHKMGWSEGQGLGRKNQGRTNIIEANARNSTAGLGTKPGIGPDDDYKSYIKKMMKSRYESV